MIDVPNRRGEFQPASLSGKFPRGGDEFVAGAGGGLR